MAVPAAPSTLTAEQSDGSLLLTWAESSGATSYKIQRSTDGVNFTDRATTAGIQYQYIDTPAPPGDLTPTVGNMYWYQVAGVNGSGTGAYSSTANMVPAYPSEMSLFEMRLRARQTADRVGSQFVTDSELNFMIRQSEYELYDILMTSYEDWFATSYFTIQTDGQTANYPVPNGVTNYLGGNYTGTSGTPAAAFYKLAGMDLNVNTSILTPSRVTLLRFNFIERNRYVYPNSTSTIYGVYNMRYRLMGNQINIIPTPAGNQTLIAWYSPRLPRLLADTDLTTTGVSGWQRYVIVRSAKYMLDKEEGTDTAKLDAEILYLKTRIEQAAQNRDAGVPDTISATRQDPIYGGNGFGGGGSQAGW
jgi:hypothetical protein